MKTLIKLCFIISIAFSTYSSADEDVFSVGVGVGTLYSGLGMNLSLVSETDMKYLSGGCSSYGTTSGITCGLGIGWIKTDLIDFGSNKHGFGLSVGVINSKYNDRKAMYGLGYHYFFNGIDKPWTHIGLSLVSEGVHDRGNGVMIELGYQF